MPRRKLDAADEAEALLRLGITDPTDAHLANVERAHVLAVVDACGGSITLAARLLGIARRSLQRKLSRGRAGRRRRRRAAR